MTDAGCQCVYVVDSAGSLILEQATDRVAAVVAEVGDAAQVGFHGHENLSLSLANTLCAIRAGAVQVDGSTRRFGAGSGNTSCEALAAVTERLGIRTGLDVLMMIDAAEDVVRPVMDDECVLDRLALIMGYAGCTRASSSTRSARLSAMTCPAPRSSSNAGAAPSWAAKRTRSSRSPPASPPRRANDGLGPVQYRCWLRSPTRSIVISRLAKLHTASRRTNASW